MRNYMKKNNEVKILEICQWIASKRKLLSIAAFFAISLPLLLGLNSLRGIKNVDIDSEGLVQLASTPAAAASTKKSVISIPAGTVKANPFLPYRDISGSAVVDVPAYNLVEPPDMVGEDSEAARVMDTTVSGILFDKYSPSAILNIEGNDYLVKKGDVVNNYRVLNIAQDSVTVKLGANTYKAGIGEILTEGSLNHNDVSNLSNKFGGER